jgi:hypothetical protein
VGAAPTAVSTSRLWLLVPLVTVRVEERAAVGVVPREGGCGVGVLRRLVDRTALRSAIAIAIWYKFGVANH